MPRISSKEKYTVQAFELFKKEGLDLNMEQIAQFLNLTKKTLYNNFNSKQELISTVISYFFSELEKKIQEPLSSSKNAIEALFFVSAALSEEIGELGDKLLKDVSQFQNCFILLNHTDRLSFYSTIIRDNLLRGISENLYRDNINIDYATLFYTSAIDRFYKWDGKFTFFDDTVNFHTQLVKHHLYSVVNDNGRKILEKYL